MSDHGSDETTDDGGSAAEAVQEKPPEDKVEEIEEERERRLDPDNRPENAEVDNTDAELPTVEAFKQLAADEAEEGAPGTADPAQAFRENPPSEDEVKEIEEERKRRLDPNNRPENAEVDNTGDNMPDVAKD